MYHTTHGISRKKARKLSPSLAATFPLITAPRQHDSNRSSFTFPTEIITNYIFPNLTMKELSRFTSVSKKWNKLCLASLRNFRKIDTYDHIDFESEELFVLRAAARHCPRLRCLNAAILNGGCMEEVLRIIRRCSKMEVLELYACRRDLPVLDATALVDAIAESVPELRVLGLCREAVSWGMQSKAFSRIAEACPKLECILCTQSRGNKVASADLCSMLAQCGDLKVLELFNMSFSAREVFLAPQLGGKINIKTLVLGGCDFGDSDCSAVARACPSLEHLDVGRTLITDTGVAALTNGNLQLKSLFLFETNISDATLLYLATESQRGWTQTRKLQLNSGAPRGYQQRESGDTPNCKYVKTRARSQLRVQNSAPYARLSDHRIQSSCIATPKSPTSLIWPSLAMLDICDCRGFSPQAIEFFEQRRSGCQVILETSQKQTDLHARCIQSGVDMCF